MKYWICDVTFPLSSFPSAVNICCSKRDLLSLQSFYPSFWFWSEWALNTIMQSFNYNRSFQFIFHSRNQSQTIPSYRLLWSFFQSSLLLPGNLLLCWAFSLNSFETSLGGFTCCVFLLLGWTTKIVFLSPYTNCFILWPLQDIQKVCENFYLQTCNWQLPSHLI